jgi:glycosyltransferase involved in cell wall biosynthesis
VKLDNSAQDAKKKILVVISDTDISDLIIQILQSMTLAGLEPEVEIHDSGHPMIYDNLVALGFKCKKVERLKKSQVFLAVRRLSKTLSKGQFKTIYVTGQYACLVGLTTSFLYKVPNRVFTRHHTDSNYQNRKSSFRFLRSYIFDAICNLLATKIVAVSQVVKDFMVENERTQANKIVVINNSVSEKFLANPRKQLSQDHIRIGVVSRLTNVKGVEFIAEAFLQYYSENQRCSITIVGADSDSSRHVHEILDNLPPENCKFIPRLADVRILYSEIDVFIHAPISKNAEAFGLVYLEALYSGLHCIFTNSGIVSKDQELRELCHIVDYKDSESILQAIRELSFSSKPRKAIPQTVLDRYSTSKMRNSYSELWIHLN